MSKILSFINLHALFLLTFLAFTPLLPFCVTPSLLSFFAFFPIFSYKLFFPLPRVFFISSLRLYIAACPYIYIYIPFLFAFVSSRIRSLPSFFLFPIDQLSSFPPTFLMSGSSFPTSLLPPNLYMVSRTSLFPFYLRSSFFFPCTPHLFPLSFLLQFLFPSSFSSFLLHFILPFVSLSFDIPFFRFFLLPFLPFSFPSSHSFIRFSRSSLLPYIYIYTSLFLCSTQGRQYFRWGCRNSYFRIFIYFYSFVTFHGFRFFILSFLISTSSLPRIIPIQYFQTKYPVASFSFTPQSSLTFQFVACSVVPWYRSGLSTQTKRSIVYV